MILFSRIDPSRLMTSTAEDARRPGGDLKLALAVLVDLPASGNKLKATAAAGSVGRRGNRLSLSLSHWHSGPTQAGTGSAASAVWPGTLSA
jgi:hypothetical protein